MEMANYEEVYKMGYDKAIDDFIKAADKHCGYYAGECKNLTRDDLLGIAIQALKKQIPKKPRKTDSYRGVLKRVYAYVCPTCGNSCLEQYMNERQNIMFCWNCSQKLDWSDENEID